MNFRPFLDICRPVPALCRMLRAEAGLIHSLTLPSPKRAAELKTVAATPYSCSSPAAQIATLVQHKNFSAAENKIRALIRDNPDDVSPNGNLAQER